MIVRSRRTLAYAHPDDDIGAPSRCSVRLYRRFGFVAEGRRRAYALRDGAYVDTLAMARLNPSPLRGF